MRGSPQQCIEKYLTLARDAASLGDPISAENYYQFADHYYRLVAATRVSRAVRPENRREKGEDQDQAGSTSPPNQSENWLD